MKFSSILLILLLSIQTTFAITVKGKIIDKETNEPIVDAVVLALSNNKLLASANSDVRGNFKIVLKKGAHIHLEVVKNDYRIESADIYIDQAFIDANPFITIQLKKSNKNDAAAQLENKDVLMEDIGTLEELPEGTKIIEAVPIKKRDYKRSNYNVTPEKRDTRTNVNVNVLKTEFNKEHETDALKPNTNYMTSYFEDGNIFYNVGKAFLSPDVKEVLYEIVAKLKAEENTVLKMTVFADANKEAKIGEYISTLRMEEVVNLLMSKGVSFEQLDINIIGNQMVRNNCTEEIVCTEEEHQENRKLELVYVE